MNKTIGAILIVLGLLGLVWGGFTYTAPEKLVDIRLIHATREKTHDVPPPLNPVLRSPAQCCDALIDVWPQECTFRPSTQTQPA